MGARPRIAGMRGPCVFAGVGLHRGRDAVLPGCGGSDAVDPDQNLRDRSLVGVTLQLRCVWRLDCRLSRTQRTGLAELLLRTGSRLSESFPGWCRRTLVLYRERPGALVRRG